MERAAVLRSLLDRGEHVVGVQAGFSAQAAQQYHGDGGHAWGWLTDAMSVQPDTVCKLPTNDEVKAEAVIAFVLKDDLFGPGVSDLDVLAATAAVCPAIELPVADLPRFTNDMGEIIAQNAAAGRFVIGRPRFDFQAIDLALIGVLLEVNGDVVASGAGASLLGGPAGSIARLVNALAETGQGLQSGYIILTGGLTEAAPVQSGATVEASFAHLGSVGVHVVQG
jgi:2-keto-4-pentenoate hydratase